ncbi:hypothetical protein [Sphingomicrobium astaxanthinifaciens]|uniref:hypothetical protein n=1 Tax=Sphingomicrobium astaxanthinifaciens TaxID=1227949 RepID=UPI001FCB13D0|nr:hypothetical protein [Sphingomicrobium astaxanthinifaciens]MCJ7421604.1 hypothetical protein [Sphingomicrobium astaxanthinifaciens]
MAKTFRMLGLAGAAAATAAFAATPAQAQYYPDHRGTTAERVIGTILNGVLNGGRTYGYGQYPSGNYGYHDYARSNRAAVDRCARAVESRLDRRYDRRRGYDAYDPYGYGQGYQTYRHGARVTGITSVRRDRRGGLKVYGLASRGYAGGPYGQQAVSDLKWDCEIDRRGRIRDIDVDRRSRREMARDWQYQQRGPYYPQRQYGYRY